MSGSTNFELLELGKILNIPNLKVVCKDELKSITDYSLTNKYYS